MILRKLMLLASLILSFTSLPFTLAASSSFSRASRSLSSKPFVALRPNYSLRLIIQKNKKLNFNRYSCTMSHFAASSSISNPGVLSVSSSLSNPLLNHEGTPLFKEITSEHVVSALEATLADLKSSFEKTEKTLGSPQTGEEWIYSNVIEDLERIQAPLNYCWGVVGHLMGVKNSEDLRKAHDQMQPAIVEINQQIGQSAPVFKALASLQKSETAWQELDESQRRIVDSSIRQMKSSGVDLEGAPREAFNKIQLELAELQTKFSNNVLDSTKRFKLTLNTPEEVDGLPESAKALAAQTAVREGHPDATAESGPWTITLDMPSYLPVMQHMKNREIREKVYRAYVTRASSDEFDNAPIIKRILQLKKDMASLLGYSCFADKSLSSKMAPSVDAVNDLIEMLRDKSFPAAIKDLQQVRDFARTKGCDYELQLWDISFWSERLREEQYQFQEEELRAYFPLPEVLKGLFQLANRLFGVSIIEANGDAQVWNDEVTFYKVLDEQSGEHIASFFLDAYSRPSEKRGGAWMDVCLGKSKVLNRKPVAYLTCNGSPPVGGKPSLMTFREVETLFHEFGHGLQHMLTRVEHGDAAGISNVEWDAVELPSQFMENWCYDRPTLYSFAKHYQTGQPLPEELFHKIKAAKNYQAGLQMMRQLFFGALDMYLHSKAYDPNAEKSPFEVQQELAKIYTVISPLPEDRFLCSFGHIFAGGYSAGYYSYKWAEVMSADAFGAFEEVGLDNEEAIRATGRRFRETVLAMGGGKHPSEVYKLFRGREPSPIALLRHSGLI